MEKRQIVDGRAPRRRVHDPVAQIRALELLVKDTMPIGAEGMLLAETIAGERVAPKDVYRWFLLVGHPVSIADSNPGPELTRY